jgi:ribosomal protein S18 acetylase RimI-like enzyme
LCLQIVRDAAKSDLLERWRLEIEEALGAWRRDFLTQTRLRFEHTFRQVLDDVPASRLSDHQWSGTHARRVVDRLGSLLELAWMARMAVGRLDDDATAALLTAVSARSSLPAFGSFDDPSSEYISSFLPKLIDETPVSANVTTL